MKKSKYKTKIVNFSSRKKSRQNKTKKDANTLESFPLLHNKTKTNRETKQKKTEQKRIQLSATEYTNTNKKTDILAKTLDFLKQYLC